jgi:hypothetical protein
MAYNTGPYYQTAMGGANFSPYNNYQTVQMPQMNNQPSPQNQQGAGSIMTVFVHSEDEVIGYPVAAGVTVLLISFELGKFWLKSTSTSGVPQALRIFPFTEETPKQETAVNGVSREEFESLSQKIDKLISDLGGNSNG